MKYKIMYVLLSLSMIVLPWVSSKAEEPLQVTAQAPAEQKKDDAKIQVDLDFKDVDIKEVARAFSRISGTSIIVSDDVKVKVTLHVQAIDWKEALGVILGAYNLTMMEKDKFIIITTFERRRQSEESGELKTRVVTLNFVDVGELKTTVSSMLTRRGKIEIDTRSNSLVITDLPDKIDKIAEVALRLDTKTPQVMIEAMMLDLKLSDEEQLGIEWTLTDKKRPYKSIVQNLGLTGATTGEIYYGKTLFTWADFVSLVNFWQEQKRVDILANPKVLTLDNLPAKIDLIEQVPYTETTTTDQGTVAVTKFKDVGIKLNVTPHITKDNYVSMEIKTEQSFRSGFTPDNQPIVDARKAETNLMVRNGETIVIGGLRKKENTTTVDKFPLLGDIPVVGNLFRRNNKSLIDTELMIFVTPYVATDSKLTFSEEKQLKRFKEMKTDKSTEVLKQPTPFPLRPPSGAR